jgi:mitochondrial protein import protein ZIM17
MLRTLLRNHSNKSDLWKEVMSLPGVKHHQSGLYAMFFTCNKCQTRAGRTFSKDSYTKGVVLIRCEGCNNLHLVADNLGWFRDSPVNIEQIMKEKNENVKRISSHEEVLEFIKED